MEWTALLDKYPAVVSGLIGALIGAVIGFLGTLTVDWLRSKREDRKWLRQERKEVHASLATIVTKIINNAKKPKIRDEALIEYNRCQSIVQLICTEPVREAARELAAFLIPQIETNWENYDHNELLKLLGNYIRAAQAELGVID